MSQISNSDHFLETLKRHFDNGNREFTIKLVHMANPEDRFARHLSPFQPKSFIMIYDLAPSPERVEGASFPVYDPEIAEKITNEGRKIIQQICPACKGERYMFFVDQGEPDPNSKCDICKGTGKI